MKKLSVVALALLFGFCITGNVFAESGTQDECVAKCKEAAKMITDAGDAASIAEINKKDGKFVWKDTYVFLMDLDGNMLAHPVSPSLIGKNLLDIKDSNGKAFFQDFMTIAKEKGEGWVDYMWPKPGEKDPSQKSSYIYRVPGKNLITGAGIYK